ncbi:hypothetical protein EMCRGX_G027264 [Ephydatia muelleri]
MVRWSRAYRPQLHQRGDTTHPRWQGDVMVMSSAAGFPLHVPSSNEDIRRSGVVNVSGETMVTLMLRSQHGDQEDQGEYWGRMDMWNDLLYQMAIRWCSHGGPVQSPSPVHMEAQCRAHLQFTWRPSASPISSSHGVQCRAHLQFTWRSSAGPISSSHRGPVQGPPPQSGTRHATQLGCCQPGLHHQGTRLKDKACCQVGRPPCSLFRAIRLPPAKNCDTDTGTYPAARMMIICLREEQMEVGSGMLATLSRCCTQKLEGPVQCLLRRNAEQQEC